MDKQKRTEYIGKRFGRLTVLSNDPNNSEKVICKCDCGNIKSTLKSGLRDGRTVSCGCFHKEVVSGIIMDRMRKSIGKKYKHLTVIGIEKIDGVLLYKCQCDCGNITYRGGYYLRTKDNASCGCARKKPAPKINDKMIGRRFGHLTVIDRAPDAIAPSQPKIMWRCMCDCGKETIVSYSNLLGGGTKSCGCMAKRFTPEELKIINDASISNEEAARLLNRPIQSVYSKRNREKKKNNKNAN